MTNKTFTQLNQQSNTILKSSINKSSKRNSKTKLTFANLNNQFNLDDTSSLIRLINNQTSHTLPKSIKHQQDLIKSLKDTSQFTLNNNLDQHHEIKISHDKLVNLFGNLNDILKFNSKFLNQLMQCGFDAVLIAQCFVDNAEGFHVYSQYCINYPKQVETLAELNRNVYTNQLLKSRQLELGHSLPLGSYLLKPIQRILVSKFF